jgi:hypothetical protein
VDDDRYQGFFLKPTDILHRRYEVLRAYFVDHRPAREIAAQFGLTYATTCSLIRDFRAQCREGGPPPFSRPLDSDVPPTAVNMKGCSSQIVDVVGLRPRRIGARAPFTRSSNFLLET